MPLLRDNDLRFAAGVPHVRFPSEVLFGARPGLFVLEIILFAIDEHDDVGVLFDRAYFTKSESSCGRFSSRFSTTRESWDSAMIGTLSSLASAFNPVVISVIS